MTDLPKPGKQDQTTGSLPGGEPVFLAVGRIRRPHGIHGEMVMEVLTDFPDHLRPGTWVYVGPQHQPERLTSTRWHNRALLIGLEGCTNPESAGSYRSQVVYVTAAERPVLPEGEFYHHQLIGLAAISEEGQGLGLVTEILETGANDVLVVRPTHGPQILIPYRDEFVLKVDLEKKTILMRLIPGLLPDEAA